MKLEQQKLHVRLMQPESPQAFFSYSRTDSEFVLQLATDLRLAGAHVWLDQLDIKAGDRWDIAIEKALANCPNLIVILSPASIESTNVMDEVSFALGEKKLVIPVLYRPCKIPFRLQRVQYVDARDHYQKAVEQLLQMLCTTDGSSGATPPMGRAAAAAQTPARVGFEVDLGHEAAAASRNPDPPPEAVDSHTGPGKLFEGKSALDPSAPGRPAQSFSPIAVPVRRNNKYLLAAALSMAVIAGSLLFGLLTHRQSPAKPDLKNWLNEFMNASQGPSVAGLEHFFCPSVSPYFSIPHATWADIAADKQRYFERFPTVRYTVVGTPSVRNLSEEGEIVDLNLAYTNLRRDGTTSQGRSRLTLDLKLIDGQWKVAGMSEDLSK